MLLITIGALILITISSFAIFDRDIFAPPTIVCLGLLFGARCAYYNEANWELDFSANTLWIVLAALASFMLGGIFAFTLHNIRHLDHASFGYMVSNAEPIEIEKVKTLLAVAFQFFAIVLLFVSMRRMTGGSSWNSIVSFYRQQVAKMDPTR